MSPIWHCDNQRAGEGEAGSFVGLCDVRHGLFALPPGEIGKLFSVIGSLRYYLGLMSLMGGMG